MIFADLIRFAREHHQITQAELAKRCGVQAPVIAVWERGHRALSERTMAKVALALGYPNPCAFVCDTYPAFLEHQKASK